MYDSPANGVNGNSHFIAIGALVPGTSVLQQTLTTTAGQAYDLSFYANGGGSGPLTVGFGNTTQTITLPFNTWTMFAFNNQVATSSSTAISFSSTENNFFTLVSVTPSIASTPEPGTLGLLGLTLLMADVFRKKITA